MLGPAGRDQSIQIMGLLNAGRVDGEDSHSGRCPNSDHVAVRNQRQQCNTPYCARSNRAASRAK